MTTKEAQENYGFCNEDVKRIKLICKIFNGKVVDIKNKKQTTKEKAWKN